MHIPHKTILSIFILLALVLPAALPAFADSDSVSLPNPIACKSLLCLFLGAIRFLLAGVAVFGTFIFIYGGFLWLTSGGNEQRIQTGKNTLMWAAIGIVIILLAWSIIKYVLEVLVKSGQ